MPRWASSISRFPNAGPGNGLKIEAPSRAKGAPYFNETTVGTSSNVNDSEGERLEGNCRVRPNPGACVWIWMWASLKLRGSEHVRLDGTTLGTDSVAIYCSVLPSASLCRYLLSSSALRRSPLLCSLRRERSGRALGAREGPQLGPSLAKLLSLLLTRFPLPVPLFTWCPIWRTPPSHSGPP